MDAPTRDTVAISSLAGRVDRMTRICPLRRRQSDTAAIHLACLS